MTGGLVSRSQCNLVLHVLLIPSRATGSLKSPFFSSWSIKNSLIIASKLKFEKNHFTYSGMRNPDKMFQKLSNPDATTTAM